MAKEEIKEQKLGINFDGFVISTEKIEDVVFSDLRIESIYIREERKLFANRLF